MYGAPKALALRKDFKLSEAVAMVNSQKGALNWLLVSPQVCCPNRPRPVRRRRRVRSDPICRRKLRRSRPQSPPDVLAAARRCPSTAM